MSSDHAWLVRARLPSVRDVAVLRAAFAAEVLRPTLRRIDERNVVVQAIVPEKSLGELQARYHVDVVGDIDAMTRAAAAHVSRTNRYRQS